MIKAAFFDIDGTLVSLKTKRCPESTRQAIPALRAKGIKCFVATGRSKFEIRSERLLDGLDFDGVLTNNGQDAYDSAGRLLYGKPLELCEAEAVLEWVEKRGCACWMVGGEKSCLNLVNERVITAMEAIHTHVPETGDLRQMLHSPVYKIVLFLTRAEMSEPMALAPSSRMTQWYSLGHDLISRDGGKRNAMLDILSRYSISPAECIAFGDSENDVEMLRAAGIGVAMGNATVDCQAAADYITADCDEDGIILALRHFQIL